MQKLLKTMHKNEKGFTLVELMVVVVIIAILIAIAIPVYQGIQANARNSACAANIRTLQGAVAQYYTEVGTYPSGDDLSPLWLGFEGSQGTLQFIETEPFCPWNPPGEVPTSYGYNTATNSITCETAAHPE